MKSFVIFILAITAVAQASVHWKNPNDSNPVINEERGNGRIVGGDEVIPHSRPFQVALFTQLMDGREGFCGGSLISPTVVLTAAHCVVADEDVYKIDVLLGAHNIHEDESSQVRITTTKFLVHSVKGQRQMSNDIALIFLPEAVELNANIAVVSLPSRSDVGNKFTGETATVSGWGKISSSAEDVSPVLRKTSNDVITNLKCSPYFLFTIRSTHVCVSGKGGHSSCRGDSGGPLTIERDGQTTQIGVVSFGSGLGCSRGFPHVYTRTTAYLDWIQENAGIIIN